MPSSSPKDVEKENVEVGNLEEGALVKLTGAPNPPPTLDALLQQNWVSMPQAATLLGRDYRTIRNWILSDPPKLKAVKVGGQYRIYEDEIRRFLTEGSLKK